MSCEEVSLSRITILLAFQFLETLFRRTQVAEFRELLTRLYKERLVQLIDYLVEFDLDSKGITNLAFYCEEEYTESRRQ